MLKQQQNGKERKVKKWRVFSGVHARHCDVDEGRTGPLFVQSLHVAFSRTAQKIVAPSTQHSTDDGINISCF
jgi:hypothetical protein